ncbi:Uncharacterised protein [Mycobacteroides abscessus subsp. massiliense]|uniref:Uncharacterized protein n=1 Tax=Mycobacteroides abscessus subsp. massiliense TaxID=1962118 RepID=A0A1T8VPY7_9MYCO|nr:Uncharacterised protein [Mycobacteroides abscessus subsp. massiliense]
MPARCPCDNDVPVRPGHSRTIPQRLPPAATGDHHHHRHLNLNDPGLPIRPHVVGPGVDHRPRSSPTTGRIQTHPHLPARKDPRPANPAPDIRSWNGLDQARLDRVHRRQQTNDRHHHAAGSPDSLRNHPPSPLGDQRNLRRHLVIERQRHTDHRQAHRDQTRAQVPTHPQRRRPGAQGLHQPGHHHPPRTRRRQRNTHLHRQLRPQHRQRHRHRQPPKEHRKATPRKPSGRIGLLELQMGRPTQELRHHALNVQTTHRPPTVRQARRHTGRGRPQLPRTGHRPGH